MPCICLVIDHRGRQNVVRTSVTHSAAPRVPLLLNRRTATWNLFVNFLLDCLDCGSHGVWLKFFSNGMLLMFRSARVDPRLVAGRVSVLEPLK